jgi:O-antigen/teichoic acid export membrane protein
VRESRPAAERTRPLLRNIVSSGATAGVNALVTALSVRFYLKELGFERYGVWATLTLGVSLILLSSVGIGPALTTRAAELHRADRSTELGETLGASHALAVLLGGLFAITCLLGGPEVVAFLGVPSPHADEAKRALLAVCALATFALNGQLTHATLVGVGRSDLASYQSVVSKVLQFGCAWGLLLAGFGVVGLACGNAIGAASQVIWGEITLRRKIGVRSRLKPSSLRVSLEPIVRLGANLALGSVFQVGLAPFSKWLLARTLGPVSVSVYEIGWSAAMQVRALAAQGLHPLVPEFTRYRDAPESTRRLLGHGYRVVAVVFTPLFALVAWLLPDLFSIWLGSRYTAELILPGRIFLLTAWLGMFGIPGYYCLLGQRQGAGLAASQLVQALINVVASLLILAIGALSPTSAAGAMAIAALATSVFLAGAAEKTRTNPRLAGNG